MVAIKEDERINRLLKVTVGLICKPFFHNDLIHITNVNSDHLPLESKAEALFY